MTDAAYEAHMKADRVYVPEREEEGSATPLELMVIYLTCVSQPGRTNAASSCFVFISKLAPADLPSEVGLRVQGLSDALQHSAGHSTAALRR